MVLKGLAGGAAGGLLALPRRPAGAITAAEYCPDAEERAVLRLLDELRARHGRAPLRSSAALGAAARHHAADMAARGYFDHGTPEGDGPGDRAAAHGYPSRSVGENIAAGQATAAAAMDAWAGSPDHRANLLGGYAAVGVGYARGGPFGHYWVLVFGGVADEAPRCDGPAPEPEPEPEPEPGPKPEPGPGPGPKPPKEKFCRKHPNHKRCRGR